MKKIFLGSSGERLAKQHLVSLGYHIIEQNFRCPLGELDLIAWDKDTLVFIEVRSRQEVDYGLPVETINSKKQYKVRRVAQYYLVAKGLEEAFCRFDVVSIIWGKAGEKPAVEVIRDAF